MRKARFLSTVAATLLLTAGIASAQTMNNDEVAPNRAPAAQQNAPAEKMAPVMKRSEHKAPATTGQAAPKELAPGHGQNVEPRAVMKNPTGAMGKTKQGAKMKGSTDANGGAAMKPNSKSSAAEGKAGTSSKSSGSADKSKRSTTGQGSAAGSARLSGEQRSKMTTIFKRHRVKPTHLNVSIRVGIRVPKSVHFYPLPMEVYEIYPEWRGYDYILVGDEILVINPRTHKIVAILDA